MMERFTADGEDWSKRDWIVFDNEACYCCFGPTTQLNAVDKARELNNTYKGQECGCVVENEVLRKLLSVRWSGRDRPMDMVIDELIEIKIKG